MIFKNWVSGRCYYAPAICRHKFVADAQTRREKPLLTVRELLSHYDNDPIHNPNASLEVFKQNFPFKNPANLERLLAAWRKAGLK